MWTVLVDCLFFERLSYVFLSHSTHYATRNRLVVILAIIFLSLSSKICQYIWCLQSFKSSSQFLWHQWCCTIGKYGWGGLIDLHPEDCKDHVVKSLKESKLRCFVHPPLSDTLVNPTINFSVTVTCSLKLFLKMVYTVCPERYYNLGWCRMAFFEDCQATRLTTQPPRLVLASKLGAKWVFL